MSKPTTTLTAHKHTDRRANIPTEELRDFVAEDEQSPVTLRYPRDPSLDPQLVWQGKDEQDGEDLAVPAVPIYIQEKIHPQSIIDDLLAQAARPGSSLREAAAAYQLNMFADFNGGPEEFDQKVEFYQHEQNWANRLILGDSLLVMASLAEKEGLRGRVQMIYLDPPYGIKFGSNWQVSTRKRDVKDGKAEDATRQPEQIRAFRDTWKLGIHSYLAYLRDRLVVARELLTETGSVFVQIGDENVHLVRSLMDEVFGSENFVSQIAFRKTASANSPMAKLNTVGSVTDYVVWYARNLESVKYRQLFAELTEDELANYLLFEDDNGQIKPLSAAGIDRDGKRLSLSDTSSMGAAAAFAYGFAYEGQVYYPTPGRHWSTTANGLRKLDLAQRLSPKGNRVFYRRYSSDFPVRPLGNLWNDTQFGGFVHEEQKIYVVQTLARVIQRCLLMTTDPGDLCLDPTCGSGTTAYVAEQWGRRWITCDTSRVALALARTRLMAAKYPYYLLADSPEGMEKEAALSPQSSGLWYGVAQSAGLRDAGLRELPRHPSGLCLQTRPARHPQVHRQQRRDRRHSRALAGATRIAACRDQPGGRQRLGRVAGATRGRG